MNKKILIKLFISTLYLSAFTFGGGYVIVTLMKKKFVDEYHWIENDEMLDLVAIAQSAPGAIAVNGAIVVGYKIAGILGVVVAIVATVIPPFLIISIVSMFYIIFRENRYIAFMLEGMQSGVGAVIASVSFQMGAGVVKKGFFNILIMLAAFALNFYFKVNVIYIILICILVGIIKNFISKMWRKVNDLPKIVYKLFKNRRLQFWWRLCGNADYSK